ncbi:hypothetical protein IGI04_039574 [Brassica rapa subsp. trilocularis]|uniref:Uncharacterized protein n=1 Tax=Brassica rapa subsp. trilocularis TaxID=1813537 RepID=A0ABQ7KK86_BRACM|nr:hypothetical protein IGI04_039574 [Brassica rapa subsp. trilocularis]
MRTAGHFYVAAEDLIPTAHPKQNLSCGLCYGLIIHAIQSYLSQIEIRRLDHFLQERNEAQDK